MALGKNIATSGSGSNNRIDTQGFNVTHTGLISGVGDLLKNGSGTLVLNNDNSGRSGLTIFNETLRYDGNPNTSGGTIRTWSSQCAGQRQHAGLRPLDPRHHRQSLGRRPRGDDTLLKTGPGTLIVTGSTTTANAGGTIQVDQGAVQMNSRDSLGGLNPTTNAAQGK